jgi:hypothetical protein
MLLHFISMNEFSSFHGELDRFLLAFVRTFQFAYQLKVNLLELKTREEFNDQLCVHSGRCGEKLEHSCQLFGSLYNHDGNISRQFPFRANYFHQFTTRDE